MRRRLTGLEQLVFTHSFIITACLIIDLSSPLNLENLMQLVGIYAAKGSVHPLLSHLLIDHISSTHSDTIMFLSYFQLVSAGFQAQVFVGYLPYIGWDPFKNLEEVYDQMRYIIRPG